MAIIDGGLGFEEAGGGAATGTGSAGGADGVLDMGVVVLAVVEELDLHGFELDLVTGEDVGEKLFAALFDDGLVERLGTDDAIATDLNFAALVGVDLATIIKIDGGEAQEEGEGKEGEGEDDGIDGVVVAKLHEVEDDEGRLDRGDGHGDEDVDPHGEDDAEILLDGDFGVGEADGGDGEGEEDGQDDAVGEGRDDDVLMGVVARCRTVGIGLVEGGFGVSIRRVGGEEGRGV